jgi:hypothetical protein
VVKGGRGDELTVDAQAYKGHRLGIGTFVQGVLTKIDHIDVLTPGTMPGIDKR